MKILVLDDGITGNTTQSLGIVEALNQEYNLFPIKLKGPSYRLPDRKGSVKLIPKIIGLLLTLKLYNLSYKIFNTFSINKTPEENFSAVISTGSYLAPINLAISKKFGIKSICIMTPENVPLKKFDLLIVPSHDMLRYKQLKKLKNILVTTCAPNRITEEKLRQGKEKISGMLNISDIDLKIGLIIGGNDQNYFIDKPWAEKLLKTIHNLTIQKKISCFLTTSRRTPDDVVQFFLDNTSDSLFVYKEFVGINKTSNYFGILGICDILLVTEDSVTMISEACSTGKPVIILGSKRKKKKIAFDTTIKNLIKGNYCSYISVEEFNKLPYEIIKSLKHNFSILKDTEKCALKIAEMLITKKF